MEVSKINAVSTAKTPTNKEVETKVAKNPKESKDGKKLMLALSGLAAAGVAAAGVAIAVKKGKAKDAVKTLDAVKTFDPAKTLDQIKFDKGVALNKDGSKFTGVVKDTLKGGDKITLNYVDGIIQSSERAGSKSFTKAFEYEYKGDTLNKVTTKTKDSIREFIKLDDGHKILEDNKLIKRMYNHKNNIVVNDFDKETGIIKQSVNFDKNTKTHEVIKSDMLEQLEIVEKVKSRNSKITEQSGITKSETWESGDLKKAEFADGTIREYDTMGRVISEQTPNGEISKLRKGDEVARDFDNFYYARDNEMYALDFPNGHKKYYDGNGTLRKEIFADGTMTQYYPDGSLGKEVIKKGDDLITNDYYESGRIHKKALDGKRSITYDEYGVKSEYSKEPGHLLKYELDGITKEYEHFADGSSKYYNK